MPKTVRASLARPNARQCKEPVEGQLDTCPDQRTSFPHPNMEPVALAFQLVPDLSADGNHSVPDFAVDHQVIISDVGPS